MTEHTYRGTTPIGEHRLYAPRTRCPCVWDWITKTIAALTLISLAAEVAPLLI